MEMMRFRRVIGTVAIVTFVLTSVLCGCKPSFAAATADAASEGCHGGHHSKSSDSSSHEHQKNCQHCNHARFVESKDAGKLLASPLLQPVSLPAVSSFVAAPASACVSRLRAASSRAAPPPIYLLKQVFLI